VIIGLVISIFMVPVFAPGFLKARDQGKLTQCLANCKNIGTALTLYADDNHGHYPSSMLEVAGGKYLGAIPACPSAGRETYSWTYEAHNDWKDARNSGFTFYCSGENHKKAKAPPDYKAKAPPDFPRYTSRQGLESSP
jgi:hypothetical protein